MATAATTGKTACVTCGKEKVAYKCEGCLQDFCYKHLGEHRQSLLQQLDEIENERNIFQQMLTEQTTTPRNHSMIEEINRWEKESIRKIQQTADQARKSLLEHIGEHFKKIRTGLTKITEELKQTRLEEDFNEIYLNQLKQKLKELEEQLNKPANISIQKETPSSFINKISVLISSTSLQSYLPSIDINTRWARNGITVAGGNGQGNGLNQLHGPYSAYVDDDQTIYVADYFNHRIIEWKKGATIGQVVAGGKEAGNRNDQLNSPTDVIVDGKNDSLIICDCKNRRVVRWARRNGTSGETIVSNIDCYGVLMDHDGYFYVSDYTKHEIRRWKMGEKNGVLVAGGNGEGNRLDQLYQPLYIFVDEDQSVYVSDYGNHRVMQWMKGASEGIMVAGGQGQGSSLKQLSNPRGLVIDQFGTVYVTDQNNHRVMRWLKGAAEGSVVIGGNGQGGQVNQLNTPLGLSIDRQNNLYVVDQNNHRIQKFNLATNSAS